MLHEVEGHLLVKTGEFQDLLSLHMTDLDRKFLHHQPEKMYMKQKKLQKICD